MPLLKLWNTLRGRSKQPSALAGSNSEIRPATEAPTADPQATNPAKNSRPRARTLGIFRGGPHAALCRQLKSLSASSVLEISVGDGSRAVAVVQALAKNSPVRIRYAAVDEFEMAGGAMSLKHFFQVLRAADISPQLFPEPIDRGLMRVAHTIGAVDLVLIAAPIEIWQTPGVETLLRRVCHAETAVFYQDEQQNWVRYQPAVKALPRAA